MANKNRRNVERKASAQSVLERLMPNSNGIRPTDKEQQKLDTLATRWSASSQNLQRQQAMLKSAETDELQQKERLLGVLEYIAEQHDVDPKKIQWAFDGQHVMLAVPKD